MHDLSFLNVEFKPTFSLPLSLSSRGSLVPLYFLPVVIICISEVVDISPSNIWEERVQNPMQSICQEQ